MRWPAAVALSVVVTLATALGLLARGVHLPVSTSWLEEQVTRALGRDVRFGEKPWIQLRPDLHLQLKDFAIANAPGGEARELLSLHSAFIAISPLSFFEAPLRIKILEVDGLRLALEADEDGTWNLPQREPQDTQLPEAESRKEGFPLLFDTVELRGIEISSTRPGQPELKTFVVDSLRQTLRGSGELELTGHGSLQDRPWILTGTHSGQASLSTGRDLWGSLKGKLDGLTLDADYRLADVAHLEDLELEAHLRGKPPPKIAELTPLLDTQQTMDWRLNIDDIDPGIAVDATLDLGFTEVHITGSADDPGNGDGLALTIDLDAASFPRLAASLGLGPTDEANLVLGATLTRRGRSIELQNLTAVVGPHRIDGKVVLPLLPGTTDARMDLYASGPDFSFYQRLFNRPFELAAPYSLNLKIAGSSDGREEVAATIRLGNSRVELAGLLGDFPRYLDSDLKLQIEGEDLAGAGRSVNLELPSGPFKASARVTVEESGSVRIHGFSAQAAGAEAVLSGSLQGYPDFDEIDLTAEISASSLQFTSAALGLDQALGEVPLRLSGHVGGALTALHISDLEARAGDTQVRSTAGALRIGDDGLASDLLIDADVVGLREVLGPSAPEAYGGKPFHLVAATAFSPEGFGVELKELSGEGINGRGRFFIGPQFRADEQLQIEATLDFQEPAAHLPAIPGYQPPGTPLSLRVDTGGDLNSLRASLRSAGVELLEATLQRRTAGSGARLTVTGSSADVSRLGRIDALPDGPLPYIVDVGILEADAGSGYDFRIGKIELGASRLRGSASFRHAASDNEPPSLVADLEIPSARVDDWLTRGTDEDVPQDSPAGSNDGRVIPDIALPTAWLNELTLDLNLSTGPLGLSDPRFTNAELIETFRGSLRSAEGVAQLRIEELRGSRGLLQLSATAGQSAAGAALVAEAGIEKMPLGLLALAREPTGLPRYNVDASFSAEGASTRALAATLSGELLITGGEGDLPNMGIELATDSLLKQIAEVLLPGLTAPRETPRAECSVLGLRAVDGIVTLDPGFVVRTERVDLSARGQVNLATEQLAIRFDNQARKGLGISAASLVNPYVQITGRLGSPKIGLDVTSSALAGGAAVATGGITVIAKPLFGRFLDRRNPCERALDRWHKTAAENAGD
ncbi:MAG: AsmA family protein [Halieaceae bacterium]|jgi:uncharacterized protein involved in outer membrane biogenesis|nr:AsmA family protein [Halieaceae bacterium]